MSANLCIEAAAGVLGAVVASVAGLACADAWSCASGVTGGAESQQRANTLSAPAEQEQEQPTLVVEDLRSVAALTDGCGAGGAFPATLALIARAAIAGGGGEGRGGARV